MLTRSFLLSCSFLVGLLATLPAARVQEEPAPVAVREKRSKVLFPIALAPVGGAEGAAAHRLAGVGLRTKTIFGVKVYAMGFYVDPACLKSLAPFRGKDAKALGKDSALFEALLLPSAGKSLRLVMRRDVDAEEMREAFDDALKPRLVRALKEFRMEGGAEALKTFRTFFDLDELEKGQILEFTWHPDTETAPGRLVTRIGKDVRGTLENAALGWALFDVYLGGKPIEPDEKPKLVQRLPELLREAVR